MNYYPHHIGDYVRDTAHLSMIEDGAYRRMIDLYYASGKPLPLEQPVLYRLLRARSKEEKEAVESVLADGFFKAGDDGWHHKRCDEEIAVAHSKSEKARISAGVRWQSERNANASTEQCDSGTNAMLPITNSQEPRTKNQSRRASRLPADWALPAEWKLLALKEQPTWNPGYCEKVAQTFRNYWIAKAGRDGAKLDWRATWHNWVIKEGPMDPRRAPRRSLGDALKDDDARH